jgi:hypothetical protein
MSTKVSIRHGEQFHLYREVFDEEREAGEAAPVYLTLRNVDFECRRGEHGSEVTVMIPAEVARALGLSRSHAGADG